MHCWFCHNWSVWPKIQSFEESNFASCSSLACLYLPSPFESSVPPWNSVFISSPQFSDFWLPYWLSCSLWCNHNEQLSNYVTNGILPVAFLCISVMSGCWQFMWALFEDLVPVSLHASMNILDFMANYSCSMFVMLSVVRLWNDLYDNLPHNNYNASSCILFMNACVWKSHLHVPETPSFGDFELVWLPSLDGPLP